MKPLIPTGFERGQLAYEQLGVEHATELAPVLLDERVWRWLQHPDEPPPTEDDVRHLAESKQAHWEEHGFGQWALRDPANGEMVGRGGLQYTNATGEREVEIGWAIAAPRWGQGLATELAGTSIDAAFESLGLDQVIAYTQPHNTASRRVMEKAGLTYRRDIVHYHLPHVLYVLAQPEAGHLNEP